MRNHYYHRRLPRGPIAGTIGRPAIRSWEETSRLGFLLNALSVNPRLLLDSEIMAIAREHLSNRQKRSIIMNTVPRKMRETEKPQDSYLYDYYSGEDSLNETIEKIIRRHSLRSRLFSLVLQELKRLGKPASASKDGKIPRRLEELGRMFGLSKNDRNVLGFLFLIQTDSIAGQLYASLSLHLHINTDRFMARRASRPFSILSGIPRGTILKVLADKSSLRKAGLIDNDLELAPELLEYIEGTSSTGLSERYFTHWKGESLPAKSLLINPEKLETLKTLISHRDPKKPMNILFYGVPGTGKTELAHSICRELVLKPYEIKSIADSDRENKCPGQFRRRAFWACSQAVDPKNSLIIVDEADTILNTVQSFFFFEEKSDKGPVNELLDSTRTATIWITNKYLGIDESTRRRFDFSLQFERFTHSQRVRVWETCLAGNKLGGLFKKEEVEALADQYETSAAGVANALRHVVMLKKRKVPVEKISTIIKSMLEEHMRITRFQEPAAPSHEASAPRYELDSLNIKTDMNQLLNAVDVFNSRWAQGTLQTAVKNFNVLLFGPPGSGKTEFAKYLARRMKRRLMVKRASDLLSMYVGESEKNVAAAFSEAERDKSILFIDEADSLIPTREGAQHSWEVSQVNEMLCAMEKFTGMLICSTNFRKYVDSAATRRFALKVEFDYLKPDGIEKLYSAFFGSCVQGKPNAEELQELRSVACLTPGDFKAVYQSIALMPSQGITHSMVLEHIKTEVKQKAGNVCIKMGF